MADTPKSLPTLEEMKRLVNEVFNVDTSDVILDEASPKGRPMKNEHTEEMAPGGDAAPAAADTTNMPEEAKDDAAKAAPSEDAPQMTAADLAELVGVDEKQLMELLAQTGLDKKPGIEAIMMTISQDETMLNQLVGLLKEAAGMTADDAGGIV